MNIRIHPIKSLPMMRQPVNHENRIGLYSLFNGKMRLSLKLKEVIHSMVLSSYSKNAQGEANYQIVQTELLYLFPEMKKLDFHNYMDKKPNIVVVVKVQNLLSMHLN